MFWLLSPCFNRRWENNRYATARGDVLLVHRKELIRGPRGRRLGITWQYRSVRKRSLSGHPGDIAPVSFCFYWSSADPAAFRGNEEETYRFFWQISQQIYRRVDLFCNLPFDKLDQLRLEHATKAIGEAES